MVLRVTTFNERPIRAYRRAGPRPTTIEVLHSYGTEIEFLLIKRSPVSEPWPAPANKAPFTKSGAVSDPSLRRPLASASPLTDASSESHVETPPSAT